jgi:sulfur-oxidizing protein SoxZ
MSETVRTLIQMPPAPKRGEVITIRATIAHTMETGYRRGSDGKMLARDLLRSFSCALNGQTIFRARLHAAMAANPYIAFHLRVQRSGTLVFQWDGDNGFTHRHAQELAVS